MAVPARRQRRSDASSSYSHRVHCIINKLRVTSKTKSHAICKLGITHSSAVWKSTGGPCSLPRTQKRGQWCRNDRVRLLPRKPSSFVPPSFFHLLFPLPSLAFHSSSNPRRRIRFFKKKECKLQRLNWLIIVLLITLLLFRCIRPCARAAKNSLFY